MRYFIQLSFDGTHYHGWQVQPNAVSVQELLNNALQLILRDPEIHVTGQGRTDTGVHASFFVAHFETDVVFNDLDKLRYRLNRFLPMDIAIHAIFPVPEDSHARFDAKTRTYQYFISLEKDPFSVHHSWPYHRPLNVEVMNRAAEALFDYIDFTSFSKLHTDVKTNNCKILYARWKQEGNRLVFTIRADRFLRNMVRAIVGTLVEVGQGKLSIDEVRKIIEMKDRGKAGASVPAEGLFLVDVEYPEECSGKLVRGGYPGGAVD